VVYSFEVAEHLPQIRRRTRQRTTRRLGVISAASGQPGLPHQLPPKSY
jgi:hypothetical protein